MEKSIDKTNHVWKEQLAEMKSQLATEKKISENISDFMLNGDGLNISHQPKKENSLSFFDHNIPGVYCKGIQYFDWSEVHFINYMGMSNMIQISKTLLAGGVEVQFVNVRDQVKKKIDDAGLGNIIYCYS